MEEQIHKEHEATVKANEHQLQTIMLELRSLKKNMKKKPPTEKSEKRRC